MHRGRDERAIRASGVSWSLARPPGPKAQLEGEVAATAALDEGDLGVRGLKHLYLEAGDRSRARRRRGSPTGPDV